MTYQLYTQLKRQLEDCKFEMRYYMGQHPIYVLATNEENKVTIKTHGQQEMIHLHCNNPKPFQPEDNNIDEIINECFPGIPLQKETDERKHLIGGKVFYLMPSMIEPDYHISEGMNRIELPKYQGHFIAVSLPSMVICFGFGRDKKLTEDQRERYTSLISKTFEAHNSPKLSLKSFLKNLINSR